MDTSNKFTDKLKDPDFLFLILCLIVQKSGGSITLDDADFFQNLDDKLLTLMFNKKQASFVLRLIDLEDEIMSNVKDEKPTLH